MKNLVLFIIAAIMCVAGFQAEAQSAKTMVSSYSSALDTATNTGTAFLSVQNKGNAEWVTIVVTVDELSGTTDGNVTLMGSVDNVTFVALTDTTLVPRINTFDTADQAAAQSFIFKVPGNLVPYWGVSYTGVGTMAATLAAKLYAD